MTKYSIYTERKLFGRRALLKIIDGYLEGYTLIKTVGTWRGKRERAWKVETILEDKRLIDIQVLAAHIKSALKQESVLITSEPVTAEFI